VARQPDPSVGCLQPDAGIAVDLVDGAESDDVILEKGRLRFQAGKGVPGLIDARYATYFPRSLRRSEIHRES
jgi:hypothetical protein